MPGSIRIASDVGGTFTDSIAYDGATRRITVSKVSTTPENRAIGTVDGLRRSLSLQGKSGADVTYVGHGMTTATNAIIQRKGARTAFVTNAGFRDLLLIGRQDRPSLYDVAVVRPPMLVPTELCFTVSGRMDAEGQEITPLDEEALAGVAGELNRLEVEAVAVLFLHSYANPAHERRAKEMLAELLPRAVVCVSTDVLREFREYERASTTVLNAYLTPVMNQYLGSLVAMLEDGDRGLGLVAGTPVMVMEAAGGLMTVPSARANPVRTVLSGPAGGVVASSHVAGLLGIKNIITMDIGGTSTDISLIRAGRPEITRQAELERIPIRLPAIDINAIGAGGGSIAWIDDGGALRVGPNSAEAVPGPACYGLGGTQPTVTDANVVLGRLGEQTRLGGDMPLEVAASERAVSEVIAKPLGLELAEAAAGILRVTHSNIVRGIRVVSVERGYDPREFTLVPFGGAGPMQGTPIARDLGIPKLLIPPSPGILCALGQLVSDLRHDLLETQIGPLEAFSTERAAAIIARLSDRGNELLAADHIPPEQRRIEMQVDMRYAGQSYELAVALDYRREGEWEGLAGKFHAVHEQRFGHADSDAPIEVVGFAMTAVGEIESPVLPELPKGGEKPPDSAGAGNRRICYESEFAANTWYDVPVYLREGLLAGNTIQGPAVIEEVSATTVLYPGDRAVVHGSGSLMVEVGA